MVAGALSAAAPFARAAAAAALALGTAELAADELRVAVAGNFRATLEELATRYQRDSGHRVVVSSGASGVLYAQIVQGAPYDVFLSADAERPRQLERAGRIVPGSRETYAIGRLAVLFAPGRSAAGTWRADAVAAALRDASARHVAIANPASAPYGRAALEALEALGVGAALSGRLARAGNVLQAQQLVASGHADAGVVALSGALAARRALAVWIVPETLHAPLVQQLALLRDSPAARSFAAFMRSARARELMRRRGYR